MSRGLVFREVVELELDVDWITPVHVHVYIEGEWLNYFYAITCASHVLCGSTPVQSVAFSFWVFVQYQVNIAFDQTLQEFEKHLVTIQTQIHEHTTYTHTHTECITSHYVTSLSVQ